MIKVEASPLPEDNQWVLDLAAKEPIILGMAGNVEPGKSGFGVYLDRFRKDRKFLGIRAFEGFPPTGSQVKWLRFLASAPPTVSWRRNQSRLSQFEKIMRAAAAVG